MLAQHLLSDFIDKTEYIAKQAAAALHAAFNGQTSGLRTRGHRKFCTYADDGALLSAVYVLLGGVYVFLCRSRVTLVVVARSIDRVGEMRDSNEEGTCGGEVF